MIVVDSSLLVCALASDDGQAIRVREKLAEDPEWHAPEHIRVEVTSALRGRVLGRKLPLERAESALRILGRMEITTTPWQVLARRVWELRDNMNPYDAAFVALAEQLDCPVVTTDRKLADCPVRRWEVRVIE